MSFKQTKSRELLGKQVFHAKVCIVHFLLRGIQRSILYRLYWKPSTSGLNSFLPGQLPKVGLAILQTSYTRNSNYTQRFGNQQVSQPLER